MRTFIDGQPARFQKVYRESQVVEPGKGKVKVEESRAEARPVQNRVGFKFFTEGDEPEYYVLSSNIGELAPGYTANQIKAALFASGWIDSTAAKNKHVPEHGKPKCFKLNSEYLN